MSDVKPGDEVSWSWGGGGPGGVAKEVKEDEVKMETKRGNVVTKKGEEGNPAVYVEREGHDVVKKANELEVEEEGPQHKGGEGEKKGGLDVPASKGKGRSKSRSPGPAAKEKSAEPEKKSKPAASKEDTKKDGTEKKKPGRKPGSKATGAKKDQKPKKRAATETGEPRRSKRTKT